MLTNLLYGFIRVAFRAMPRCVRAAFVSDRAESIAGRVNDNDIGAIHLLGCTCREASRQRQ